MCLHLIIWIVLQATNTQYLLSNVVFSHTVKNQKGDIEIYGGYEYDITARCIVYEHDSIWFTELPNKIVRYKVLEHKKIKNTDVYNTLQTSVNSKALITVNGEFIFILWENGMMARFRVKSFRRTLFN